MRWMTWLPPAMDTIKTSKLKKKAVQGLCTSMKCATRTALIILLEARAGIRYQVVASI